MIARSLILAAAAALLWLGAANADYLQVSKPATLKQQAAGDGDVLARLDPGAYLRLDGPRQTNGYYRATDLASGASGWIYRTLVRRYRGEAPGSGAVGETGLDPTSLGPLPAGLARVHFIDVGQGNAALLEFSCGAALVDAGGQNERTDAALIAYLDAFFDRRPELNRTLDTIFITHTHTDHNRALQQVVETFTVMNYVWNGDLTGSGRAKANWMDRRLDEPGNRTTGDIVTEDEVDRAIGAGGLTNASVDAVDCAGTDPTFRVFNSVYDENPGWTEDAFENDNNKSVVVRMDFGEASFLFTGDLEDEAIETMVEKFSGTDLLDADVYEVGHHGSANGTTEGLLDAVTPKIAVISCGPRDDRAAWTAYAYGHPRQTIVDMLDRTTQRQAGQGSRRVYVATKPKTFKPVTITGSVYATGWDGTVVITANQNGDLTVNRAAPIN